MLDSRLKSEKQRTVQKIENNMVDINPTAPTALNVRDLNALA